MGQFDTAIFRVLPSEQPAQKIAGHFYSGLTTDASADFIGTLGITWIFEKGSNLFGGKVCVVTFARNAPSHTQANEASSVIRLIVAIMNDERWTASPHGLARCTDPALMHVHTAPREDRGVRRIWDRHPPGRQWVFGLVLRITPNQQKSAAPEAAGCLCALFVEVARSADCR